MRPIPDPYRVLGIPRGAEAAQIKAAHRRLAKRFHPDGSTGDEQRFLLVQDAYQLLSDPLRRREWDRRNSARPMDAQDRRSRPRSRATSSRWTREDTGAYRPGPASRRERRRAEERTDGSGRDPRKRHHTWSAKGVPWWEDFVPRSAGGEGGTQSASRPRSADEDAAAAPDAHQPEPDRPRPDFDVFSRSSGAAWSMAARRHFRRDDADLPSRGAFRYRGTQVVTGAEARKVAAEEAAAEAGARTTARQRRANDEALARRRAQAATAPAHSAAGSGPSPRPKVASDPAETRAAPAASAQASSTSAPASGRTRPAREDGTDSGALPQRPPARSARRSAAGRRGAGAPSADAVARSTLAGAVIAPVSLLAGAGAAGALDGAAQIPVLLLTLVSALAGAAIGRVLVQRRQHRHDTTP